jgi:hypothetical protein
MWRQFYSSFFANLVSAEPKITNASGHMELIKPAVANTIFNYQM